MPTDRFDQIGLSFDDVSLVPGKSSVLPHEVEVRSPLTRDIFLNIPLLSAAMDTVTEARMAIALAREGGIGVLHRNMSIERQAEEVDRVKRTEFGMITDPVTLGPKDRVGQAEEVMARYHISGVPITDEGGKLIGILTNRDLRWETDLNALIEERMTKENLVTVPDGTTIEEAQEILKRNKVEKLPVVDDQFHLTGLFTVKDIQKRIDFPLATKDAQGRLRVAAAVGVGPEGRERAKALVDAEADVLIVDVAHGHSEGVAEMIRYLKENFEIALIAGNVVTAEGVRDLALAGADAVKIGVGPGSICTTRVVTGVGVPQLSAVAECAQAARELGIPIIADGGVRYSGDVAKCIAAGASTVMIGSLFAGVDESPGELVFRQGERYKEYRGMGSIGAMKERGYSADRYAQKFSGEVAKLVPEGIEGVTRYKGPLGNMVYQLIGGLRSSMHYVGAATIDEMQAKARFVQMSAASIEESHPHDVIITKESPNYSR